MKKIKCSDFVCVLAAAVIIISYFEFISGLAVNIPIQDDYRAVLGFLSNFKNASGLQERLSMMFTQSNEHRILFNRIVSLAVLFLHRGIDFRILIFIGNLSLLILSLVLYKAVNLRQDKIVYFLPCFLILFQPVSYENIFWATASLSNFWVLLFTFTCILLLSKGGRSAFTIAIFFAALAIFTQGGGIFVLLVGLLILGLRKEYKRFFIWLVAALVFSLAYFFNYQKPVHHSSLTYAFLNPFDSLKFIFFFLGASLDCFNLSLLAGILVFLLFVYLTLTKFYKRNLAVYSFLAFLYIDTIGAVITRVGFGTRYALSSRYTIISLLILINSYMAFVEINQDKKKGVYIFIITLVLANIFNLISYRQNKDKIIRWMESITLTFTRYMSQEEGMRSVDALQIPRAINDNIYNPPAYIGAPRMRNTRKAVFQISYPIKDYYNNNHSSMK